LGGQPFVPFGVMQLRFRQIVSEPVNFDDHSRAMEREIGDVATDGCLASHMKARLA
jgi:hypothetical protein